MFSPTITQPGLSGWTILKATYTRQLDAYSSTSQVRSDVAYMRERLSEPMALESFLDDRRLMRVALSAFDLGGEEWKRGFIEKVLLESAEPQSPFLSRLSNPDYLRFSRTFTPVDGQIRISEAVIEGLVEDFEEASFRQAVGEVDNDMRLALNYEARIRDVATSGSDDDTIAFRLLGNVPMRSVLETALNLPSDISRLPVEKQSEILQDKLSSSLGVRRLSELADPASVSSVIQRFHAMRSLGSLAQTYSPASVALTLLGGGNGVGTIASQNLFMSRITIA